jgi:hypothetical protein
LADQGSLLLPSSHRFRNFVWIQFRYIFLSSLRFTNIRRSSAICNVSKSKGPSSFVSESDSGSPEADGVTATGPLLASSVEEAASSVLEAESAVWNGAGAGPALKISRSSSGVKK